ncbi:MAG: electron transfer flavoprotein-ubiquinone oxidoreductase [Bdellovibrionales bacterium]|nr:electron transfer flavoprotein-ubiquinone oxidoreductase [Bdellovibrionales bacterium]
MSAEIQRETMECDLLIVGGGSAGLSAAIHFMNEVEKHNTAIQKGTRQGAEIKDPMVVVLEKASEVGAHSLSGAVMNPIALKELVPNFIDLDCPIECTVSEDEVYFLTEKRKFKAPITPPPFHNIGNYTISISKFNRWLGAQAEAKGVNIFPGFSAVEALYEGDKVVGVRTGDKGRDKAGKPKTNFEPGMDIRAKLTIFAEGTRGSLFKKVAKKLNLRDGKNEEIFEEGVKEIIQCREGSVKPGLVIHTAGWPFKEGVGGTFIYSLPGDKLVVGLVGYMDTPDPLFDPHRLLQQLKSHPFVFEMIRGGKVIAYGGKTLPSGGWFSMPKLYHDGMMVTGDSASMVDVQRLKGIHLAMKSGMIAAETAVQALSKSDFSQKVLSQYEVRVRDSYIGQELYKVRNFQQTLSQGILNSLPALALQEITGGRGLRDNLPAHRDATTTESVVEVWGSDGLNHPDNQLPKADGILFFDKLSSVYLTGSKHDEDSPNHLLLQDGNICRDVCAPKYQSPCNHFCPANVYEMVDDEAHKGKKKLHINFTNCIHCKSCDIKCPFDNIDWTTPEGGGGPQYTET